MISVPPFFLLVKIVDKTIPPNSRFKLNSNCGLINLVYEINSTNFFENIFESFWRHTKTLDARVERWTLDAEL